MVQRILAAWYFTGQNTDYPAVSFSSWNNQSPGPNVQGNHAQIARAVARDGIVLLKNVNNTLPLNRPASLAIIGQDGFANPNGPNACVDRGCNTGTLAMVISSSLPFRGKTVEF
jgi:beta-glucosidase